MQLLLRISRGSRFFAPTVNTTYRGAIVFGLWSLRRPEPAERSEVPIHFIGSIRDLSGLNFTAELPPLTGFLPGDRTGQTVTIAR